MDVRENAVRSGLREVELRDRGLLHRRDEVRESGVYHVYPAESQLFRVTCRSCDDLFAGFSVEISCRLIGKKYCGMTVERSADGYPLLLAA